MSSIEERLQRDIAAVTQRVVVTDSDLRDARESMEDRIDSKRERIRRRSAMAAAAAVIIPIVGIAALQTLGETDKPVGPSEQPTETFTPPPASTLEPVPIEPGTYRMPSDGWAVTEYSVTIPEGWTVQYGHDFIANADTPNTLNVKAIVVDEIFDDACHGEGVPVTVGPGTEALVTALQQQAGSKASPPVQTTLGDHPATRVDLRVPKGTTPDCRMGGRDLQVWYSESADDYLVFTPDYLVSIYVLDVDGQRQVFVAGHGSAASDEELAELQSVLDSIQIH